MSDLRTFSQENGWEAGGEYVETTSPLMRMRNAPSTTG
jgi:hypothetical protein